MLDCITKNFSKPTGFLGRILARSMNIGHKNAEIWALSNTEISEDMCVLDVGCGGGLNLKNIASKIGSGKVFGVDYSSDSVEVSKKFNKISLEQNKMEILQASVSKLPFEDEKFDVVTAFETIYFWPDILNDIKEVKRVLKTGGKFYVFCEICSKEDGKKWEKVVPNLKFYDTEEILSLLNDCEFKNCDKILHENGKWCLVCGTK